jgi:hypothetical protein
VKVHLSGVPVNSCYLHGRGTQVKKKLEDGRAAIVHGTTGKVRYRKTKGDPEVDMIEACPLRYLGVGLRRHPDEVVEIGDGNLLKRKKR